MNDCLVKVNEENQNQAISRCQSILRDRREALPLRLKAEIKEIYLLREILVCSFVFLPDGKDTRMW